ncbi:MAG: TIGR04372 family glycosyltransferase [Actinomycetota bacterium]|nr:TIGR04372 family glycosyltransferase [Actinomycetota bacterium]
MEIQPILSERIGHFALEPELLLCRRATEPRRRRKTLFFVSGPVSNRYLLAMWRRALPFGPAWLLQPIHLASSRFPWVDLGAQGWDVRHFDLRALDLVDPQLDFTSEEIARGQRLLAALGIPEGSPYVCLAARDTAYLQGVDAARDWSYHDYRNSDIRTYASMAHWLANRGYFVLRMGSSFTHRFVSECPMVIDYAASPHRSDFADVFLYANCDFSISTATGVDSLAMVFRRPMGLVNFTSNGGFQLGSHLRMLMLKDFIDLETGARIDLLSARYLEAMQVYRTEDFRKLGIAVLDNTPEDLTDFARELVELLEGSWVPSIEHQARESAVLTRWGEIDDLSAASFHLPQGWLRARM